jgi:hypothetical protein
VLISALVRRSRLGYPQGSHIVCMSNVVKRHIIWEGRAEALLNRDASNVKISLCAVMTLTSHNRQSDERDHACASPYIRYVSIGQPSPGLGPVDPTSHSASHSGPGPLADPMVRELAR